MRFFVLLIALSCISNVSKAQNKTAQDSLKTKELNEVIVVQKKKAIEQKADRTIFDFSEQAHLNSGSVMEGLKKLPGLIISDVAGMMYQGKQLEVYMDGRPLNIYSNELNSYLESLPANAIEKVEVITQPGAEFPATSGGAIINIVTSKRAKNYLTATYSNGYSYTKYDDSRHKFNNSLLVSAKNSILGWQVQVGQSYNESYQRSNFYSPDEVISKNVSDRINRFYFIKTGLKFDFKKDRLLVNYDFNTSANTSYINAEGFGFTSSDKGMTDIDRHDVMLTYQKRFEDITKKLDFRFNYNVNTNDFVLLSRDTNSFGLENLSDQKFYQFKTDYSQEVNFLEESKWSVGALADRLDFTTKSFGTENLDYWRTTLAAYTEWQTTYKKFDFILGGRLESYKIEGNTDTGSLTPFDLVKFFPNATVQYNLMEQVSFNANYNKKISLPNTYALNPNNTNYQNPNVSFYGNPNLDPTIFDNYEIRLSAYEYFFIGYSVSDANNQVVNRIIQTNDGAASTSINVPRLTVHNFNFGLPIPYMLFTKGLKETLSFNFNPDEINFMYFYVGHQKHVLDDIDYKGFWVFNLMSQLQLPAKIKFTANYNTSTKGGNYQYYAIRYPLSQQFDLTFSKKFLNNNLSMSVYINDVFNTNKQKLGAIGTNLLYDSKYDSRRVGFSLNYKIPTKNRLAKVENNMLNNDKKEEGGLLNN
ncbi:TonB-dependent receptor [Flavobacterium sp. NRK F10]|uniref:TonB-dependent receptor domain-containing protein n=1 Tax=Flavobacterium sp. NRK F10 TaxID=2954931 RepID=UPI002090966F|nr:TonB-dependent receptor [Flavobacterium sp. NRK F10]MCO6174122.1 TonB-dependent receptor [Flavobacterium sp. NRK F10]